MAYIKKKNKISRINRILQKPISRTLECSYNVYKEQFIKNGLSENDLLSLEDFVKECSEFLKSHERGC